MLNLRRLGVSIAALTYFACVQVAPFEPASETSGVGDTDVPTAVDATDTAGATIEHDVAAVSDVAPDLAPDLPPDVAVVDAAEEISGQDAAADAAAEVSVPDTVLDVDGPTPPEDGLAATDVPPDLLPDLPDDAAPDTAEDVGPLCDETQCLIDDGCVASGASPPGNPCSVCEPGSRADAWTWLADHGACDDGDEQTHGDWCVAGACEGFSLTLFDLTSSTADRFLGAAGASSGVHATAVAGSAVSVHLLKDGAIVGTEPLGSALDPVFPAQWTHLVVHGDDLEAWSPGDEAWLTSGYPLAVGWGALASSSAVFHTMTHTGCAIPSIFCELARYHLGARKDAGAIVRVCTSQNQGATYSCVDQPIADDHGLEVVGFAGLDPDGISPDVWMVAALGEGATGELVLMREQDGSWQAEAGAATIARRPRQLVRVNDEGAIVVGEGGLLALLDAVTPIQQITPPASVGAPEELVFRAAVVKGLRVWVLGDRTWDKYISDPIPQVRYYRHHFLLHASTAADLTDPESWEVHSLLTGESFQELGYLADRELDAMVERSGELWMLGGWDSGSGQDAVLIRGPAFP